MNHWVKVYFSRGYTLIEDFMLNLLKCLGSALVEVRFSGYLLTCTDVIEDESGNVVQINCTYDPESVGGWPGWSQLKGRAGFFFA